MLKIRKAIKQFKDDFILEPNAVPLTSSLRSDTSSSPITSDDISMSWTRSIQSRTNRDGLPPIPVEPADSSNSHEAVSPLQKRSLFQSLQHNTPLVSPNEPLPSIEGGPSRQDQSKSLDMTPILRSPVPANPMNKECPSSEKRTNSSNELSVPSILPSAIPFKQVFSESSQHNSPINKVLPHDQSRKEFESESAPLASQLQELKGAQYDTVNDFRPPELGKRFKLPVRFSIPLNASSETTNGNAVSSTPVARKIAESLSNSTSLSSSEANDGQVESKQSSVAQTSRQSRESLYDDSVIQTTTPTAINDHDNDDRNTLETKDRRDPTPITQPLSLTSKLSKKLSSFFKRENSILEEFLLDGPSTSSSVQSPSVKSAARAFPGSNPKDDNIDNRVKARRMQISTNLNPFLLSLAAPPATPAVSTQVSKTVEQIKTPWRLKPFQSLQPIDESSDSFSANSSSALSSDDLLARKMEELGRIRRVEARKKATSQRLSQPIRTTTTLKAELRPYLHQEDGSSDVAALPGAAYVEQQQALQTQLDKVLAGLRDARAENKRLTNENQSQHYSILQLRIARSGVKNAQDHSSAQIRNQLHDVTTSLTVLNKEKKGWQDELDSMQHKLSVAERQVRCLGHLTRQKLESRQEAAYGQPKPGKLSASVSASMDIIRVMGALNRAISKICTHLVDGLQRTSTHSNKPKLQAQKVLGGRLTAMMEDQATATTSGYNTLLMKAVLEVFMVHWCSSIIQASYPKQESFADLLVRASAKTARTSESSAICGKQIPIVQPTTPYTDNANFKDWMTGIMKELDFLLMVAGVKIKIHCFHLFCAKTLALVKVAHALRIAMAEQDIPGGLEIVIVPPDMPFQENWMLDAHADLRKSDINQSHVDVVAGTSGIGLRRKVLERADGHFQYRTDMELKPKVILSQILNVGMTSQPSPTRALSHEHGYPHVSEPLTLLSVHRSAGCDTQR